MTAEQDLEATVVKAYGTVFPPNTYKSAKQAVHDLVAEIRLLRAARAGEYCFKTMQTPPLNAPAE